MRRFAVGILMALILPLTGCTVAGDYDYDDYPRHGGYYPPPARDHWRWDDDLRVYVNPGYPRVYYHDHTYYRWHDNRWSAGRDFNGPWRAVEHRYVPSRLGQRYYPRRLDDRGRDYRLERHDDRWDRHDRYEYRPRREIEQRQRILQQRSWQQRQEIEQRQRALRQRHDDRQDRQWQPGRQDRQEQRDRQWQQHNDRRFDRQRDERRHEQRREVEDRRQRQERRAVSSEAEQRGNRSGYDGDRQGGRQWQGHGQGRSER